MQLAMLGCLFWTRLTNSSAWPIQPYLKRRTGIPAILASREYGRIINSSCYSFAAGLLSIVFLALGEEAKEAADEAAGGGGSGGGAKGSLMKDDASQRGILFDRHRFCTQSGCGVPRVAASGTCSLRGRELPLCSRGQLAEAKRQAPARLED